MSLSANYGFSPGVSIAIFIGLAIGGIIALMSVAKIISVIVDRIHDIRMRRYLNRHPSGRPAMRPGEGFSDWDPGSGWEQGGIFDRAAGHNDYCNRGSDYEPGSIMDRAHGHSADRCYDRDSISGRDWDYGRYS
jgi:hypothetical protein